jgi:transcriptional regulator with XRE-family HTH domain
MNIHLKGKQVAAARQLAGFTLDDLTERSGVSRSTLVKIEAGAVQPREGTLTDIVKAFATAGVEFIEGGARWIGDTIRTLEGDDAYLRLLDEVYQTLRNQPSAEVLSICTDDALSPPEVVQAIQRWHDAGIKARFLAREKSTRFDFPLREYRLIPERFYTKSVMVVFDQKAAILSDANNSIIVIRDVYLSDMLRKLFEMIWQQAPSPRPPPKGRK